MAVDLNGLRPQIRQILSAPGTDLSTISAKRVRRRLLEMEALTPEFIRENKDAVDAVIGSVFEKVQSGQWSGSEDEGREASGSGAADSGGERDLRQSPRKRKVKDDEGEGEDGGVSSPKPKKARKPGKKSSLEQSDAELARQLSNEINSRSRRSTTLRGTNGSAKKGGRKAKSSEMVDSDDEGSGGERPKKKKGGGPAKGGFAKEYILRYVCTVVVLPVVLFTSATVNRSLW